MKKILAQGVPGVTKNIFDKNPLDQGKFGTVGTTVTTILPYVYVAAGLAMFVMIIIGGISLMLAGGDANKTQAGYGKIKAGLIGFFLVFLSYAIVQLLQTILGIEIL